MWGYRTTDRTSLKEDELTTRGDTAPLKDNALIVCNDEILLISDFTGAEGIKAKKTFFLKIKKVYFNEKKGYTTVLWTDGSKTVVKCSKEDTFSKEEGILHCIAKRWFGNTGAYKKEIQKAIQNSKNV